MSRVVVKPNSTGTSPVEMPPIIRDGHRNPCFLNLRHTGGNANHLPPFHGGDRSEAVASQRRTLRLGDAGSGRYTNTLPFDEVNLDG